MDNMKTLIKVLLALIVSLLATNAFGLPGESIVFDPGTGNYLVTYLNTEEGKFHQIVWVPATKFKPSLDMQFKMDHRGDIHYAYTLVNGKSSQQKIRSLGFDPVSSVTTPMPDIPLNTPPIDVPVNPEDTAKITEIENKIVQVTGDMVDAARYFDTPALWHASLAYSRDQQTFRIGWWSKKVAVNGLHPGERATFGFKSRDLPGIILTEIHGFAPDSQDIPGEETQDANDGGFGQQFTALEMQNFIPLPAAVPMISTAKPFDAARALKQLKDNVAKWPDMTMGDNPEWPHMNLIDSTTATAITSSLQTAIDEVGAGQNDAAIRTLKSIRSDLNQMLSNGKLDSDSEMPKDHKAGKKDPHKAEQAEANRKLVSEVLQFDLKYISRALGSREDE